MKVSATIASLALLASSTFASPTPSKGKGDCEWYKGGEKQKFSSTYSIVATPDQVVNGTTPTGGLPGAIGYYDFGLNKKKNQICYDIRLYGFKGEYVSPAITATHIHEAAVGQSGPPRIAFPNPTKTGKGDERRSKGCMTGPFITGLDDPATGLDYGENFRVGQIDANPAGFFCDVHSSKALAGAVRGQLDQ